MADAIDSIRRLFLTSTAVMIAWILLFPATLEIENRRRQIAHAHAWIALTNLLTEVATSQLGDSSDEPIDEHCRRGKDVCEPLEVRTRWPTSNAFPISLVPLRGVRVPETDTIPQTDFSVYRLKPSSESTLPFADYGIIVARIESLKQPPRRFHQAGLFIVEKSEEVLRCLATAKMSLSEVFEDEADFFKPIQPCLWGKSYSEPKHWRETEGVLRAYSSYPSAQPLIGDLLEWSNKGLWEVTADFDRSTGPVSLMGLEFPSRTFVLLGTTVLSLIAIWSVGPTRVLWKERCFGEESCWVMVTGTGQGLLWKCFEWVLTTISILWVLGPLILGLLSVRLETTALPSWFAVLPGLVASTLFGSTAVRLRQIRVDR